MEKPSLKDSKKRKHKSEFFTPAKPEGRITKPKRLSCIGASEYLQIEESQTEVANFLIEHIFLKVFDSANQARVISQVCTKQMDGKVKLLENYEMYTMQTMPEYFDQQISLEDEPKTQPNYKVIIRKDKNEETINGKDLVVNELNKNIFSNSKGKFYSKQKLVKMTNTFLASNQSSKSIKSMKSSIANQNPSGTHRIPRRIQEEKQNEKEKDKRLRQQVIKKLMRQYQTKLNENPHPCPEPLMFQYRSFFTQPQTKEEENLRASFLQLRELKLAQQKLNGRKTFKKVSTQMASAQNSERQISNSTHLPKISNKSSLTNKKEESFSLFTQDDNGKIIRIKNNQKVETREHSVTTHETYIKTRETNLKEISNIYKPKIEELKNDKIKDESTFLNQNSSIVSTLCHSVDEQTLDKSIMENFSQKRGVLMKRSNISHKPTSSIELSGFKLPSIMKRK